MTKSLSTPRQYGKKLIDDFLYLFNCYSIENRAYGRICLHTIIGQVFKNCYFTINARKIDIRFQGQVIQSSGSGKGAGVGIAIRFMEALGLKVYAITKITDAGLIGTIGRFDHKKQKYIIEPGILKDADVIVMEEAGWLYDTNSPHNEDILTYIQICCNALEDKSCLINKKLGPGAIINFKPHASFLLLSYMPEQFMEKLLSKGMIQRFGTVIRDVDYEERLRVLDLYYDGLNVESKETYDELFISIYKRLQLLKTKFGSGQIKMTFTPKAQENLRRISKEMFEMMHDASPKAKPKLKEFTIRLAEMLNKLSCHHALLRYSTQVELEDTQYAKLIYTPIWRTTMAFIEISLIPDPKERARMNGYVATSVDLYKGICNREQNPKIKFTDKNGAIWVRRETMLERLRLTWSFDDCSKTAANEIFHSLEREGKQRNPKAWFQTKKIKERGSAKYVKLLKDLKL